MSVTVIIFIENVRPSLYALNRTVKILLHQQQFFDLSRNI
tara:strand:- start:5147 stop:5266 length:120 start_codon:yes stop_codon:yes gene_type:complete